MAERGGFSWGATSVAAWSLGLLLVAAVAPAASAPAGAEASASLIQPHDLEYLGAFRLPGLTVPVGGDQVEFWGYSGYAATFYPDGDPEGPDDGFPGSIFCIGHDQTQRVAEISIPAPVNSRTLSDLNVASTLQPPADIIGGVFEYLEMPRAGLEYLPPREGENTGRIHYCWGQHLQDDQPSHGWFELDLSAPQRAGPWRFGAHINYTTNDYLFEIPQDWADRHVAGQRLASGRFRDGRWSGLGPALHAYAPPAGDAPPAPGERIDAITTLLLYGIEEDGAVEVTCDDSRRMQSFGEADEWSGGAWLTRGDRAAVVLVGTKGTGEHWYGYSNGVRYPMEQRPDDVYPPLPDWPHDARGFWSEGIRAQMVFFDPDDLAAVAAGQKKPWEPQPYAVLAFDDRLFDPGFEHERAKRFSVGAACFDRERGLLYVFERMVPEDDEKSVIHVWRIN